MGWVLLTIFFIGLFWGWIAWAAGWGTLLLILRWLVRAPK